MDLLCCRVFANIALASCANTHVAGLAAVVDGVESCNSFFENISVLRLDRYSSISTDMDNVHNVHPALGHRKRLSDPSSFDGKPYDIHTPRGFGAENHIRLAAYANISGGMFS